MVYRMLFDYRGLPVVKFLCLECAGQYQTVRLKSATPARGRHCEGCGLTTDDLACLDVVLWDEVRRENASIERRANA